MENFVITTKGKIFNKRTNELIMYPQKYIPYKKFIKLNRVSSVRVHELLDAIDVYVYFSNNKWVVSSKASNNAFIDFTKYKLSVGEMFMQCLKNKKMLLSDLDMDKSYKFQIQHIEYRNIVPIQSNNIILLYSFDRKTQKIVKEDDDRFKQLEIKIDSFDSLTLNRNKIDFYSKGFVLTTKNKRYFTYIVNIKYDNVLKLLPYYHNINDKFAVLEAFKNRKLAEYLFYFPEFTIVWKNVFCKLIIFLKKNKKTERDIENLYDKIIKMDCHKIIHKII